MDDPPASTQARFGRADENIADVDSVSRPLALAGLLAPVLFLLVVLGQSLLRREHDLLALPMSALAAGPAGWVQDVNFVVFGGLMGVFAWAVHRRLAPHRPGRVGPLLVAVGGLGLVAAGLFPATDAAGAFTQARPAHAAAAAVAFFGTGMGFVMTSWRLRGDARHRTFAPFVFASGAALVLLFVGFGTLARPAAAPLHPWMGAYQALMLAVWTIGSGALALRLRR